MLSPNEITALLRANVRRCRFIACITAALFVTAAATADITAAYVPEPVVSQNIPSVAEHVARGGATAVPGVDCGTRCAEWWVEEHRPLPNQATSEQMHRELRNLRSRGVRVLPKLRVLGSVGLAAETFRVGWKIGTGVNTKFLRLGLPPKGPPSSTGWGDQQWMQGVAQGAPIALNTNVVAPEDGFRWDYSVPGQTWFGRVDTGNGCGGAHPPVPSAFRRMTGTGDWCYSNAQISGGFIPEREIKADGAVDDYNAQPYDRELFNWDGKPSDKTDLETRTRTALESGEYPRVDAWLAEKLDPLNHDTATDEDDDCALGSGGTNEDPGLGRGSGDTGEEFQRRYDQVPSDVYPAAGLPSVNGTVYLRWGLSTVNTDNTHIEWRGWGYRKIKAKHGWSPEDLEATRVALLDAAPDGDARVEGRAKYRGPEYTGRNGARCRRLVIVNHALSGGAPHPEGIVTSFGYRID